MSTTLVSFFGTAAAATIISTEVSSVTELAYASDVSASDLLHGLSPVATGRVLGQSLINDGVHGGSYVDSVEGGYTTVGATAEFDLGAGANGTGYDITSIQSIAAWVNAAFGNQGWTLEVKSFSGDWSTLATIDYQPLVSVGATKVTLTDVSGVLATGVQYIRLTADSVFVLREIDIFGESSASETIPPVLMSVGPDAETNVSLTTTLVANFDEGITLGTGDITIVNLDTLAETVITLPDSQVSVFGSLLIVEPSSELLGYTNYAVQLAPTVIDDLSGNSFAGIEDTSTWTFTTTHQPLRIMCIGDSITVGYTDNPTWTEPFKFGYRSGLYTLLNDAGYNFQFVGESPQPWNNFSGDPTYGGTYKPAFDLRDIGQDYHQGGEGAPIEALGDWLDSEDPDVILLMIGINGINTDSPTRIASLVDTIVTDHPDAHLIVAQITPYSPDAIGLDATRYTNVYNYNVYIRDTLVPAMVTQGHNVSTVDMYSLFLSDPDDYTSAIADGMHSNNFNHPYNQEYELMAQRWFD